MLAEAWRRMDRKIATGPRSKFVQFAEDIVVAIGWSEKGIADAVADALRDWRNRAQKKSSVKQTPFLGIE
jgi:hypothetical protein